VTKAFVTAARVQAKLLGMPELALAVVGHPFAAQNLEVTHARADEAIPQIIDMLLMPSTGNAAT
jgi:hypothetical protein